MKTSVALIGFMGTGKSTIAKALSRKLGKEFVEVDALIEYRSGKSISRIFQTEGESAFRKLEIEVIQEISKQKNQVISCGGGVVLNNVNIENLKRDSVIIWLFASPETIAERTAFNREERPLLNNIKSLKDLKVLIDKREHLYQEVADLAIDTSNSDVESIVDKIIDKVKKNADFSTEK